MGNRESMFPRARIPYGIWGSSYFPAWQTSPLAEVNIGQFAAEAMNRILGLRKFAAHQLDYLITASTVPWHWKFWNSPLVSSCLGHRVPGYHVEQACATGLQAVILGAAEVESRSNDIVGIAAFDRTSDSPVGVFPERRVPQRTFAISDVWDNFGFDPATGHAMITAAGNAARKHKLDRKEVDELAFFRYEQYFETLAGGFLKNILVPLEILNARGKVAGLINADTDVLHPTLASLKEMPELDTCVTSGTQTHASDGMACLLVTSPEKARELSPRPEIDIHFIAKTEVRTHPSLMPEAPSLAAKKILRETGLKMGDIAVVKSHNPFAVNDVIFSKVLEYDWHKMNNTGCSLVWGHPQGPTLVRLLLEGLEEAVVKEGGYVMLVGCAAGDVGIAVIVKVDEGRKRL